MRSELLSESLRPRVRSGRRCPTVAVMESAYSRLRMNPAHSVGPMFNGSIGRGVLRQSQVCAVLMIQVINTTPILLKSEKSGMRGIRGAVGK